MKTISIINLKGGVGKTTTAVNLAYVLGVEFGKRILLVDNDKQGNASQHYGVHDYDKPSVADVFESTREIKDCIAETAYSMVDMLPSNMNLSDANLALIYDAANDDDSPKMQYFQDALAEIGSLYDFCIIDNAPDVNMCTVSALIASDYVMIPVGSDAYATDGFDTLMGAIDSAQAFNPKLEFIGCVLCKYISRSPASRRMAEMMQDDSIFKGFTTVIRYTPKVDESTFYRAPVFDYSPRSAASEDYRELACELLDRIGVDVPEEIE